MNWPDIVLDTKDPGSPIVFTRCVQSCDHWYSYVVLPQSDHALVPKVPTEAMRIAALNVGLPSIGEPPLYEKIWTAMLGAAKS